MVLKNYDYLAKIIVVGNPNVGKSSVSSVLSDQGFDYEYNMTIGVDFFAVRRNVNNIRWKMHLWDTAGQESFKSITRSYYREAAITLLVFDLSRRDTFLRLDKWKEDVERENTDTLFVLVGNKKDLQRKIEYSEANDWAKTNNMMYIETSAKNNQFGDDGTDMFSLILNKFNKEKDKNNHNGVTNNNNKLDKRICSLENCLLEDRYNRNKYCCIIS